MAMGFQRRGVGHWSFANPGAHSQYGRSWSHHTLDQARPGARRCGICGRWVIRGMGRWWERG